MQPNAGPPQFRGYQLLLQTSVYLFSFFPLGEAFGPWLISKIANPKAPEKIEAGKKLVAFQMSWLIYRFITVLVVALFWISSIMPKETKLPEIKDVTTEEEQFTIPGEPSGEIKPEDEIIVDQRQQGRDARQVFKDIKDHPELFFIQSIWNQPRIMVASIAGMIFYFFLWFLSMAITAMNMMVVVRDGKPWYPLTLPWLSRPKGG